MADTPDGKERQRGPEVGGAGEEKCGAGSCTTVEAAVTGAEAGPVAAAQASSAAEEVSSPKGAIEFDVLRNAMMHTMRQRWFDALHRWLMFLIVLTGTAGVGAAALEWIGPGLFAAATALLATLDLVLDLRSKSRAHDDLRRRYYLLLAEIVETPDPTASQVAGWRASMMRLTAEEIDQYRAVDCLAYNAALASLDRDSSHRIVVPWYRRIFAQVRTFPGVEFENVKERDARRARANEKPRWWKAKR